MNSWLAIIAGLQKALGRSVLLAGLLPAFILILSLQFYTGGVAGVLRFVLPFAQDGAFSESATLKSVSSDLLASGALVLVVAGLFFTLRGWLLFVAADPPASWLQRSLFDRQFRRWQTTTIAEANAIATSYALEWIMSGLSRTALPSIGMSAGPNWECKSLPQEDRESNTFRQMVEKAKRGTPIPLSDVRATLCLIERFTAVWCFNSDPDNVPHALHARTFWEGMARRLNEGAVSQVFADLRAVAENDVVRAASARRLWPNSNDLRPTIIGNTLAQLEAYCENRFDIPTSVVWLRLVPLLEPNTVSEVASAQVDIQAWLNTAAAFISVSTIVAVHHVWETYLGQPYRLPTLLETAQTFIGGLCFAYFAYQMATYSVRGYSERVVRIIDLQRDKLFRALRLALPENGTEERKLLAELGKHFVKGEPLTRPFTRA